MKIESARHHLPVGRAGTWLETISGPLADALGPGGYPLRFAIVEATNEGVVIEATVVRFAESESYTESLRDIELLDPRRKSFPAEGFALVQVVPTGIRCEFGGYAGDACPVTNLLASCADFVIAHPNAVNASDINEMAPNVLYLEGKNLDDFLLGHIGLVRVTANRVGTFIDPTGSEFVNDVVHALQSAQSSAGIDCDLYTVLDVELGASIEWSESGCALGTVHHPEAILRAVEGLLARGVEAVGGVSVVHGVTKEMFSRHLSGEIPNPSGGIEAIITHLVSKVFRIPSAHAPLPYYQDVKERSTRNPRASAEFISTPHYFSVLKGLARAPRLVPLDNLDSNAAPLITVNNVGAIVAPASCLGGIPALAAEFSRIPLVAVRENTTILNVTNEKMQMENVIEVDSYLEAAGVLLALRKGISLSSLRRPVHPARRVMQATGAKGAGAH